MNRHIFSWQVALVIVGLLLIAYLLAWYFGRGQLDITVTHADHLELKSGETSVATGQGPTWRTPSLSSGEYTLHAASQTGVFPPLRTTVEVPSGNQVTTLSLSLAPAAASLAEGETTP
jgi:cytoskeletal protein RodZ